MQNQLRESAGFPVELHDVQQFAASGFDVKYLIRAICNSEAYQRSSKPGGGNKDAGPELLVQAVHAAAVGDALIAPNITRRLLSTLAAREPSKRRIQPTQPLTDREEEVLALVARGRTNAEIAADLFIGLTTAKTHVASLLTKIGARNRVEIAMWAYDTGRVRE